MTEDPMIAALLREREGLASRGMSERVAQVDEQLALRGYNPPAQEPSGDFGGQSEEQVQASPPKRRRAPKREAT